MAMLNLNPADFEHLVDDEPEMLPVGEYQMHIINSEMRDTKMGDGQYLWLEFEILGPRYVGRRFWDRLNLFNKNETAVKIARKTLANICSALNFSSCFCTSKIRFLTRAASEATRASNADKDDPAKAPRGGTPF
jgi:hypothetical protein